MAGPWPLPNELSVFSQEFCRYFAESRRVVFIPIMRAVLPPSERNCRAGGLGAIRL